MDVDAVKQWTRDALLVFGDDGGGTGAGFLRVSVESTWAGIHRGNQLKICREGERAFCAADSDNFVFHRLAHHFEDACSEFGEFIEEQDAAMSEGDFSGLGDVAATDKTSMGNGVMRRTKWTMLDEWSASGELVCYRIDACDIQRFFNGHFRQNARQGAG